MLKVVGLGGRQVELLSKALADTINIAGTFTTVKKLAADLVVSNTAVELAATVKEFVHGERRMNGGLVNDGSLVSLLARGNDGVDAVLLDRLSLDDGLDDVMEVVVGVLIDMSTHVDDLPLFSAVLNSILVLPDLGLEELSVLGLARVLLVDVSHRNDLLVVHFGAFFDVVDGLDVVLDVMNMTVLILLTKDLLGLDVADVVVDNMFELVGVLRNLA